MAPCISRALLSAIVLTFGADALATCRPHFEVARRDGSPLTAKRIRRVADDACSFDVRLQVRALEPETECDGVEVALRGMAAAPLVGTGEDGWRRVTVRAGRGRANRHLVRARVRDGSGVSRKTRLMLRCEPSASIPDCDAVLAESTYCFLGGGAGARVVGLDTGMVCGPGGSPTGAFLSDTLAVWRGDAYTCGQDSVFTALFATPLAGGESRRIAGPCSAVAGDDDELLVLPAPFFDHPKDLDELRRRLGRPRGILPGSPVLPRTDGTDTTEIRAYDDPGAVPRGPYRVAWDLDDIVPESPCALIRIDVMTARDGVVYASGCTPEADGSCGGSGRICVFDTRAHAELPSVRLEAFDASMQGLSAIAGGRLVVLTGEDVPLPDTGYGQLSEPSPPGTDRLHVFDAVTGAVLRGSIAIGSGGARGLACVSREGEPSARTP